MRGVSYLKIFVVAGVWAGVTTSIPLLANGYEFDSNLVLLFFQRMLFVLALILPFEIRDMQLDLQDVRTLPQKIGIQQTKKLGLVLLLFVLTFEFLITDNKTLRNVSLGVCFGLLFFIMRSKEKQSTYYSSFWVEAVPVFWWLLLLAFHN